ncbi:response regulator [Sphingomonas sp.]|uniref:response regulator n=1 Tax=Sphingomonas sp. TaxID=28214 RepID=UPI001AFFC05E|nr:response regulator [Sphingomonas sp.]MBO9712438.1 response regulator [Sphingomonas sp.]
MAAPNAPLSTICQAARMHAPEILLVEDDDACAEALGEMLADGGHACVRARDPGEALLAIGDRPRIGLLLLDLHLPEMDGLRLLSELRTAAGQRGELLQAILCSGAAQFEDLDGAMRLGVSAFLPKPIERIALLNALTDAAGTWRSLERDRAVREGLAERFRQLEGGLATALREMAEIRAPLPAPAPPMRAIGAPGVDRAWEVLQSRRLVAEARALDRLLARHALDTVGWRVMLAMFEADANAGEASATNIALACGASASAGLRRIGDLADRGLLDRREDPGDGRRIMLRLTDTGRALCSDGIAALAAAAP